MHRSPVNKYYIGITCRSTIKRWHLDGSGYKAQPKFYNAILKYGWDNFEHTIIAENLSQEEACKLEQDLIIKYDSKYNGYNSDDGGDGSFGHVVSDNTRAKMASIKKGKPLTEKQIMASKNKKGLFPIYVFTLDGKLYKKYDGYKFAANDLKIPRSTIINCCNYAHVYNNNYIFTKKLDNAAVNSIIANYKASKTKINILVYDLTGVLINTFTTYKEASQTLQIPLGSISKVCGGFDLKYKQYIFLKVNGETIQERLIKIANNKGRDYAQKSYIIKQYDLNNNLIDTYTSYNEAANKTGISKKQIINNCVGKSKTCKKFIFIKEVL